MTPVVLTERETEARAARAAGIRHVAEAEQIGQEVRRVKDSYLTLLGQAYTGRLP